MEKENMFKAEELENDSLKDYSPELREIILRKNGIFCEYRDKSEIGSRILDEMLSGGLAYGKAGGRQGFFLSQEQKIIGTLSQSQGLLTLATIANYFDVADENEKDISNIIAESVDNIISSVMKDGRNIIFDASPYDINFFNKEYGYTDTITWVVSALTTALIYLYDYTVELDERAYKMIEIINTGLKYICDSYIVGDKTVAWNNGWNFTKKCEEPSLYFSYIVSDTYLTFYEAFYPVLNLAELEERRRAKKVFDNKELRKAREEMKKLSSKRLAKLFGLINEGKQVFEDGSLYDTLRKQCGALAYAVWECTKDGLAENFYNSDLQSKISEDVMLKSTSSDALFNTLFVINIIINGGLDEDMDYAVKQAGEDKDLARMAILQSDYDNMFQTIKIAFEKVSRVYDKFKRQDKEYIVDEYVISFPEDLIFHKEICKEIRKKRLKAFSLIPQLIRTKSVISEYLVNYPQLEMVQYLEMILMNRAVIDEKNYSYKWCWSRDGYFSPDNYYYVLALQSFYNYYERFEKVFTKIENDNAETVKTIRSDLLKELEAETGTIGKLRRNNSELEEKLNQYINKRSEVEDTLNKFFMDKLRSGFADIINEFLSYVVQGYNSPNELSDEERYKLGKLNKNLKELGMTFFGDYIKEALRNKMNATNQNWSSELRAERYKESKENVEKDINSLLTIYVQEIVSSTGGKSAYVAAKSGAVNGNDDKKGNK